MESGETAGHRPTDATPQPDKGAGSSGKFGDAPAGAPRDPDVTNLDDGLVERARGRAREARERFASATDRSRDRARELFHEAAVPVAEGDTTEVHLDLPLRYRIETVPVGAMVSLESEGETRRLGTAPLVLDLARLVDRLRAVAVGDRRPQLQLAGVDLVAVEGEGVGGVVRPVARADRLRLAPALRALCGKASRMNARRYDTYIHYL